MEPRTQSERTRTPSTHAQNTACRCAVIAPILPLSARRTHYLARSADRPGEVAGARLDYSLVLLSRCAAISFFSSSGVSFGRSIDSVILLIFPVKAKGTL